MDNHYCVPEFETDEDYFMPSTSGLNRMKKSAMVEDEMMELLWQNGQVVVQSQNHKSHVGRKSRGGGGGSEAVIRNSEAEAEAEAERIRTAAEETARQHVFMQEDEMASWLHYPFDEPEPEPGPEPEPEPRFDHRRDIYADLLYHPPFNKATAAAPPREIRTSAPEIHPQPPRSPPPPPARRVDLEGSTMFQNFMQFARLPKTASSSSKVVEESTVVESNDTPMVVPTPRTSILCATPNEVRGTMSRNEGAGTSTTARELTTTCDLTVASSPDGSGASASASADPPLPPPADGQRQPPAMTDYRKRKGREADDNEDNSVGIDFESGETKKHARGSTSTKKSRAAEVHNLSERKRRDRINEKMRALQELIPRCNKSDKASMLDEAIEYLKSLQLQVQMMSMGCSMVPMMYPGVQHYMPAMGMGMGMGMGIDMGMNRPMMPYPHLLPGSAMPNPAAAAHMGPRFPMPAFHMPPVPVPDPSRVQASNASDSTLNSSVSHSVNQPRFPNFVDPYQQYLSLHQGQVPVPQNQAVLQPSTEKPSSSRKVGNPEKHQPGS